jgi:DNA-binding CsgD family transcriptional regulator
MASFVAALDGLRSPRTRWVVVSGEPGTGKTRLLAELCAEAEARGYAVLVGRGAEMERELPFAVWVDALDDHVAALGRDRLEALIGDRVAELARVLPSAGTGEVSLGGLPDERFRAHRAVRALLQQMAARLPLVLVLDDVHWADDASFELLAHLLRRPAPARILIALAFREGQVPTALLAALEAASRDSSVTAVRLTSLSPSEADSLVGDKRPAAVRQLIYRQSGGNPFYLQELARAPLYLVEPPADEEATVGVPAAVAAALGQEIGGLSERSRRLAWGAAVAGDPFDLDLAAATAALSDDQALGAMDELLSRGVLRPTTVPRRYAFRHPIVRHAVYEAAGEAWRQRAHSRAARALADRPSDTGARAHHIERCAHVGDQQATDLLEQAAREAATRAPAVAARWLTAALRLSPDMPEQDGARRLGMLVALASAHAATGRLAEALSTLQEALDLVPPSFAELRVRLIAACAACENPLGRHDAAHARLRGALDALPDDSSAAAASLQVELATDALYDSDFAAMREWAAAAVKTAQTLGELSLLAVAQGLLCFAEYGLGQADAADAARVRSATGIDALSDEQLAARLDAPLWLGFAEYFCEHYGDAARHFRRGIAVSRASRQGQFVVQMMVGLAQTLERLGALREAFDMAEAAVEAARLARNRQVLGLALVTEAWTAAALGGIDHARAAADEAVALLDGLDESVLTRATHAHIGVMWLEVGEPARCIEQLRAVGLPDFPLIEPGRRAWLYAALARAELERGDRDAAAGWVARSETTVQDLGLPLAEAWTLRARALMTLADGDPIGAAELASRAAERADAVCARVPAARCRTLEGLALARAGERDKAVLVLTGAEAELAACEASRFRDEAARELRRLGRRISARQRRPAPGQALEALTGRELEIVERVALGRTNREIAGELFLSQKTVEGHLAHVFAKLRVSSRAEVAEAVGRSSSPAG